MKTIKEFLKDKKNHEGWINLLMSMDLDESASQELAQKIEEMQEFLKSLPISADSENRDLIIVSVIIKAYQKHNYLIKSCKTVFQFVSKNISLPEINLEPEFEFIDLQAYAVARLKL